MYISIAQLLVSFSLQTDLFTTIMRLLLRRLRNKKMRAVLLHQPTMINSLMVFLNRLQCNLRPMNPVISGLRSNNVKRNSRVIFFFL